MIGTVVVVYVALATSVLALFVSFVLRTWVFVVLVYLIPAAWLVGGIAWLVARQRPKGFLRLQVAGGRVLLDAQPVEAQEIEVREFKELWRRVGVGVRVRLPGGWEESRNWLEKVDPQELAARFRGLLTLPVTVTTEGLKGSSGMGGGAPSGGF